jgi:sphingomyelin phosphodiesterase acid-like 3
LISTRKFFGLRIACLIWLVLLLGIPLASSGQSPRPSTSDQQGTRSADARKTEIRTVPALMVSDIHFDPFHDPARVQQLIAAPVAQWSSILAAPPSADQPQAFEALQQKCHVHGVDTPYTLLHSSMVAMGSRQLDAKFITLSGDLIAHSFYCKYTALVPASTQSDYQAFVLKTLSFVMGELRAVFPRIPIYVAFGNNDTACDDYRFDSGSEFLAQAGRIVAEGLPSSQRQQVRDGFARGGYYSVTMRTPMRRTRLVVVNDIFLSRKYSTCAGKADSAAGAEQMKWLQEQLEQARRSGEKVWVMGHIPPGVDPYSTIMHAKDICAGGVTFLSSDRLADLLIENAAVIRLAIFAHTHMDEIRLLEPEGSVPPASSKPEVAVKIVPSISPMFGNNPSFTIAHINPSSAVLQDYEVIAASNQTGVSTTWSKEYDYAQTYHEGQFTPAAISKLITEFKNDRGATDQASLAYIRHFYAGDRSTELKPFWPFYVCILANHTAKAFAACACSAAK